MPSDGIRAYCLIKRTREKKTHKELRWRITNQKTLKSRLLLELKMSSLTAITNHKKFDLRPVNRYYVIRLNEERMTNNKFGRGYFGENCFLDRSGKVGHAFGNLR
jgi:hypothetical protein